LVEISGRGKIVRQQRAIDLLVLGRLLKLIPDICTARPDEERKYRHDHAAMAEHRVREQVGNSRQLHAPNRHAVMFEGLAPRGIQTPGDIAVEVLRPVVEHLAKLVAEFCFLIHDPKPIR